MIDLIPESIFEVQCFEGLGSFTPRTFSILAITALGGTDFPASQAFTSALGIWIIFANCY
jgi:hypothetical protein